MLLLIVSIAALVVSFLVYIRFEKRDILGAPTFCVVVLGIFSIIVTIEVLLAVFANIGVEGTLASKQARYDSLVYQFENNLYDNDNDLGKKELYDEIREWNEEIACGKVLERDLWLGAFFPDIYGELQIIEFGPNG